MTQVWAAPIPPSLQSLRSQGLFLQFPTEHWARFTEDLGRLSGGQIETSSLLRFSQKHQAFLAQEPTSWDNLDQAVLAMSSWPLELWSKILASQPIDLEIILARPTPLILKQACAHAGIQPSVQAASCLAGYGMARTPAFVSNSIVDFYGGKASAFSSLLAHEAVIFEGYRPHTYTELIQIHEGFHSAMRRLQNLNRIARLKKWKPSPLAPNWSYDSVLQHYIDSLGDRSAPDLGRLGIDQRFTSDHHGVIMATLHHGLWEAWFQGHLEHDSPEELVTVYPFHYIAEEQSWTDQFMWDQVESLRELQSDYLQADESLAKALTYLATHLQDPELVVPFKSAGL